MKKLAIITSHPIQYYAPLFRHISSCENLTIRVFYLWDFGVTKTIDLEFNQSLQWDIPLLDGYDYEFVPNTSQNPGTSHFWGLQNPTLMRQVKAFQADAVLLMSYNYASLYHFIFHWQDTPLMFRGDSHRLVPETGFKANLKRQWIRYIYQHFDACLYVGQANRDYFRFHGVKDDRLFFSPHAIDRDRFLSQAETTHQEAQVWKQALGIPAHFKVILFAGKLIPKKRPQDLLQAFLNANLPETALLFVGSGVLETQIRQQAQTSGYPHIYFAPFQNQSQMPRTYAIADLVVLPSSGSGETWGLAINEAMTIGKAAIVSTHVGCAADLIQPYKTGLTFPAQDITALTAALQVAFSKTHQLEIWGRTAQEHLSHYSYTQAIAGILQAFDHCLGSSRTKQNC